MISVMLCPNCHKTVATAEVFTRQLNTTFADNESNQTLSCRLCFEELWDFYEDGWSSFYSNCGAEYMKIKAPSDKVIQLNKDQS